MSFRLPRCARIIEKCKGDAEAAAEKLLLEGHSAEIAPQGVENVGCVREMACLRDGVVEKEAVVTRCPFIRT